MSTYINYRDPGQTNEEGFNRFLRKLLSSTGVISLSDLAVSQRAAGANKSVDIAPGDVFIPYNTYGFHAWNTATVNDSSTIITDNSSGNPRIDTVVAYIDLTITTTASANTPGGLKFMVVAGTPAGSPSAPSDPTIQSTVGASNPFVKLANIAVSNGFTSIVNANITDTKTLIQLQNKLSVAARAYQNVQQLNLANGSWTRITLDAESYDIGNNFDSVTNYRFTVPISGYYQVNANLTLANVVTSTGIAVGVRQGGSTSRIVCNTWNNISSASSSNSIHTSDIIYLPAGDYIEMIGQVVGNGTIDVNNSSEGTYMSVILIGV